MNRLSTHVALAAVAVALAGAVMTARAADEDPAAYFENECLDCHRLKKKPIEDKHLTRQEWKDAILKMIELDKLDPLPSKQYIEVMSDWLAKNHGPAGAGTPKDSKASE
jgi:hypothetical protein